MPHLGILEENLLHLGERAAPGRPVLIGQAVKVSLEALAQLRHGGLLPQRQAIARSRHSSGISFDPCDFSTRERLDVSGNRVGNVKRVPYE